MPPEITLYTKGYCPHCKAARALLSAKGVRFVNHDIDITPERRGEMIARAGGRTTVPQIFIADFHVGGNSDLTALNSSGTLDALLNIKQPA
ncbi:glutaredoxin 3 [Roseobacter denitrificans]|uniref:Glutaredoxin n=1 Tax=Roseobacter denitrificans (strain ATCC 33942 / OCh 114) TaxID=375451 RepID=Q167B3_ROSDO|nr:glutaredoxin 3 [Roseobacter denitrificans]ABG31930.1 glutaredoxin 3 [Roseobacter denitrificans OCh 114]AVL51469.1 glutaredoxin 3 [Roseobacter denitrificans]